MHYTGMAAMRLAAHHHYPPRSCGLLSVLLAVVISLAGGSGSPFHFREEKTGAGCSSFCHFRW